MTAPPAATAAHLAASGAGDLPATADVDVHVAGLAVIRLVGPTPSDRAAVEAQFGAARPAGAEPADITIRYTHELELHGPLRYLGPGEMGFADDAFVVLHGRFRKQVRVRLPVADLGGPCEVRCEHGVGRVPHLVALVNLAILANGGLALHASGFVSDHTATIATGWSKGGKTEALLAFCQRGARYLGDEWLHFHPDGRVSGIEEPLRVWDWHLDQLPEVRAGLAASDRRRLSLLRMADRIVGSGRGSERMATAISRQRFVDAPAAVVAPHGRVTEPVPMGTVFLMTSADQPNTVVRAIPGREVADRMAASLAFERSPLMAAVTAHRYAFPSVLTRALDEVPVVEQERLRNMLDHAVAAEVSHPYPVDLADLADAMSASEEAWE